MSASDILEWRDRRRGWAMVSPALAFAAAFFVASLVTMAAASTWAKVGAETVRAWGLGNYAAFLARPHFVEALVSPLQITAIVTLVSVLLAYRFAWILATRVPARWQRLAILLAILPSWTSYVVRSYAWLLMLSRGGVVNTALMGAGLLDAPLEISATRLATVAGFLHGFVMLLTLTIYASPKQLPPNCARAAASLGAGPVRTFWQIILPLTLPGVMVGAFLTFVLCIGDYVTPQILGGTNELVLPQVVMLQLGRRADLPMAGALSMILMCVVVLAYPACARRLRKDRG